MAGYELAGYLGPSFEFRRTEVETILGDYLRFLRGAGVEVTVSPSLLQEEDHRGPLLSPTANPRRLQLSSGLELLERFDLDRGLGANHASLSVAEVLAALHPSVAGQKVVDMGCGTGVLGIVAALNGAQVVGTDVDPVALELTRLNAEDNGVSMELRLGSLCEPLGDEPVDLFLANLPHKPSAGTDCLPLSQDGGPDGDSLFSVALPEMARRQLPRGRLLFSLHSLPHPRLLRCAQRFYTLELVRWKLRWLAPDSYGGLRLAFRKRHKEGTAFLVGDGGREGFITGVWVCRRSGM